MKRVDETTGASTVCVHSFETRSVSRRASQTARRTPSRPVLHRRPRVPAATNLRTRWARALHCPRALALAAAFPPRTPPSRRCRFRATRGRRPCTRTASTWIVAGEAGRATASLRASLRRPPRRSAGAHVVSRAAGAASPRALRRRGLLSSSRSRTSSAGRRSRRAATRYGAHPVAPDGRRSGPEPPAVTPASPKLALIDSKLDRGHPEFADGRIASVGNAAASQDEHGTATARRGRRAHERPRDRGRLAWPDRHELRDRPLVRRHRAPDPAASSTTATRS